MNLNLQLFGDTSRSGSSGAAGKSDISGNQYKAYVNFWRGQSGTEGTRTAGVYELIRDMEKKNGGPLSKEKVSVQLDMRKPIGKVMDEIFKSGGSENFKVVKNGFFRNAESNRAGIGWLTEYLKKYMRHRGKWW